MKRINGMVIASLVPFCLLIVCFLFIPFVSMIMASFQSGTGDGLTLDQYKEVFASVYYHKAFKNSILISFVSSLVAIAVGVFASYAITLFSSKIQERILVITNLTSNFAGVPLAFAFIVLIGNSGVFTLLLHKYGINLLETFHLYSWSGLVLIYIYFQLPLCVMFLYPVFSGIQVQWKEAASLLGASTAQFWWKVGLPFMLPSLAGTFSILFANAMGAYASVFALTGSSYNLVTIRIGALVSGDIFARPELGSALAVILGLILVVAMLINEWLTRKVRRDLS
ncbi:ABC transporter permease [Bacillus sp. Hm123]|uniref:ABC transporter permease n=1 Tax=Bacillus sp. Hm123 TaxID=3450745 RepID=UPI003F43D86C